MIQRIQSVYFGLAGIITLLLFFVTISFFAAKAYTVKLNALGISPPEAIEQLSINFKSLALTITTALAGLLPLVAVFLYKNRPFQIRLGRIAIVLMATIVAQNIINTEDIYKQLQALQFEKNYSIGFILPVISIILTALGIRGVRKDEALVKSMDRIR